MTTNPEIFDKIFDIDDGRQKILKVHNNLHQQLDMKEDLKP